MRRSGGGLLLPRLVPIGDPELDERIGGALEAAGRRRGDPAGDRAARAADAARPAGPAAPRRTDAAEALRLAEDLARTLDQLLIEEVDPARLADFAADLPDLSLHWQKSLDQLRLILDRLAGPIDERGAGSTWPTAAIACSTPSRRRWRDRPPAGLRLRRRHHHRRAGGRAPAPDGRAPAATAWSSCPRSTSPCRTRNGRRSARTSRRQRSGSRPPAIDRDPPAIPPEAAARPDGRRPAARSQLWRRGGGRDAPASAQPRHRPCHGAACLHREMAAPAAAGPAADRRPRARARRSGRGSAGDRASRCARRSRSPGGRRRW